ncbi:MAG: ester cyclase [Caulobacteraceae bacterium]
MPDGQARKERLAHFVHEVWDCGREEAVERYLASSYTLHHDPGDPWEGRVLDLDEYKTRLRVSRAPFPDQQFEIQRLCSDGDTVIMTWLWRATHLGDFPGFPATGEVIRMSGATAYLFDSADRLSGHWQITDRLGVFQQLQKNKAMPGAKAGSKA